LLVEQQETLEKHKQQLSELENSWIYPSLISAGIGVTLGVVIGVYVSK
jgi:hypothetical protein